MWYQFSKFNENGTLVHSNFTKAPANEGLA